LDKLDENQKIMFKKLVNGSESDKAVLFEETKKECLDMTNQFLKEDDGNDIESKKALLNVKEKLLEQKFIKDTFISEIISLITLKETLLNSEGE
jgi:hypothetical protein